MKLSTLHEARNPKLEKELKPVLTAPFRNYGQREKIANKLADQHIKKHGVPDRHFLPNPNQEIDPQVGTHDGWRYRYQPTHQYAPAPETPEGRILYNTSGRKMGVPVAGQARATPISNKASGSTLNKAIAYWQKSFNGERWSTLEQAFLNREWTYRGGKSAENSARTSLFKYLNNLKTPWQEGIQMADRVLASTNGIAYIAQSPDVRTYALSRPRLPELVNRIKEELEVHSKRMVEWKVKHDAWEAAQRAKAQQMGSFHDEDTFGYNDEPEEPRFWYGDIAWAKSYIQ